MPKTNKRNYERKNKFLIKNKDDKLLKKSKRMKLCTKNVNIPIKTAILKAKKNQLRCHYCKLLLLRSNNIARHLKTQHPKNPDKKNEFNGEIVSKDENFGTFSKISGSNESREESNSNNSDNEESEDNLKSNNNQENFIKIESKALSAMLLYIWRMAVGVPLRLNWVAMS